MTIINCSELPANALHTLLDPFNLKVKIVDNNQDIPGSFWGETEAGLIDNILYIQPNTPVHSALHEACHYICMDKTRRLRLDTNAGGDYDEENAVCYLQLLLSNHLHGYNLQQHFSDMDNWGYTFRLGSAKRWFLEDAEDAKQWLLDNKLINNDLTPSWQLRND